MKRSVIIVLIAVGLSFLVLKISNSVVKRNRDFMVKDARNAALLKTTHASNLVSEFIKERLNVMDTVASWMNPFWSTSPEAFKGDIAEKIKLLLKRYPGFDSVHFLNRQGVIVWGIPENRSMEGVRLSKDIYNPEEYEALLEKARKRKSSTLAPLSITEFNPLRGELEKTDVLLIVTPVYRSETYMGSLLAIMRWGTIGRLYFPPAKTADINYWVLVDAKGVLLYANTVSSRILPIIRKYSLGRLLQKNQGSDILTYNSKEGKTESLLVSCSKLSLNQKNCWYVIRLQSLAPIEAGTRHWLFQTRAISMIAMAIMVFAAVFIIVSLQRSEKELDTLNRKHSNLLDNLLVGVYTFDRAGRIDYINRRACEILGYAPEELIGKDRLTFAWEKERKRVQTISGQRLSGKRGEESYRAHMVHKSGKVLDVEIYASPIFDAKGNSQGVRVMFTDISRQLELEREIQTHTRHLEELVQRRTHALRESEALYRTIFDTSLAIIYIHQDDRFRIMNRAGMAFFGFKNRDEMLRANVWDTIPEGERERRRNNARRRISGEDVPGQYESLAINKDGESRVVVCNFQRILYRGEAAILAILFDITDKKRLEAEIAHSQKLTSMGQLATGVAHDFNNILSAVLGRTQLLKQHPEDSKTVLSCAQVLEQAVEQGVNAIKRIQEFTRVRRDQAVTEPLFLHKIIEDAIEITSYYWKDQAQKQGVTIQVVKDLHDENRRLPAELREAFMNLILNAVDAMPEGGTLQIETQSITCKEGKEGVRITFRDTGTGMPPEVLKHAMDPFYTTKGEGGTGLGLSIVSEVVERLGGTMSLRSKEAEGTSVILELPWQAKGQVRVVKTSKPIAQKAAGRKRRGSLLVVDDEPALTKIFIDLLTPKGIDVIAANSGEEGVSLFLENPRKFALIFTDLGMPKMNGWEFVRRIRGVSEDIPIVLMTGWGLEISNADVARAKITELVAKPVRINTILEIVSRYISES